MLYGVPILWTSCVSAWNLLGTWIFDLLVDHAMLDDATISGTMNRSIVSECDTTPLGKQPYTGSQSPYLRTSSYATPSLQVRPFALAKCPRILPPLLLALPPLSPPRHHLHYCPLSHYPYSARRRPPRRLRRHCTT